MTNVEFMNFVKALKTYYPKEKNLIPNEQAMQLWFLQLKDIDYKVASVMLNEWAAKEKWSPSIADIREQCTFLMNQDSKDNPDDWSQAWEQVLKAIRYVGMYREDEALDYIGEYSELAKESARRLGFKDLCLSENQVADRARFAEIYKSLADRKHKDDVLSLEMLENREKLKLELAIDKQNEKLLEMGK